MMRCVQKVNNIVANLLTKFTSKLTDGEFS
jgi:hypothetical protein